MRKGVLKVILLTFISIERDTHMGFQTAHGKILWISFKVDLISVVFM